MIRLVHALTAGAGTGRAVWWDSQSDSGGRVPYMFPEEGYHGRGKDKDWKSWQDQGGCQA